MAEVKDTYTLQVGVAGQERLEILHSVHAPYTRHLWKAQGLGPGQRVLELGCGPGFVTAELAEAVGWEGQVTAIDKSEAQLELARNEAYCRGLENIRFLNLSAEDLPELDTVFDLVYVRFVLCHLARPEQVLSYCLDRLRVGGRLLIEEPTGTDALMSEPPSAAFDRWKELVVQQAALHGTDFSLGRRLPRLLEGLGARVEWAGMIQPLLRTPYEKRVLTLGAVELMQPLVETGVYTHYEMETMIRALEDLEQDTACITSYARTTQVAAVKV